MEVIHESSNNAIQSLYILIALIDCTLRLVSFSFPHLSYLKMDKALSRS